jgi:hypothetical protein
MTIKKTKISEILECKTKLQAIELADREHPPHKLLKDLYKSHGIKTPEQIRSFVIFNMLRSISEKLDPGLENIYLNRIQENILRANR